MTSKFKAGQKAYSGSLGKPCAQIVTLVGSSLLGTDIFWEFRWPDGSVEQLPEVELKDMDLHQVML